MAKSNFAACLDVTLKHEGGYSDHPSDPGGATNRGITIGRLSEVRGRKVSKSEVKALSMAETRQIYERYYWRPVQGDSLPHGIDLVVFDFAVNSGPARGARYLQWVVGTKQDGVVGPDTLAATVMSNGKGVIQQLCARRLSFVRGLSTFSVFGRGWSRRIADVEAKAVVMWLTKGKAMSAAARKELEDEANKARDKSDNQSTGAGGAAGGGGAVLTLDWGWVALGAVAVLVIAGLVLYFKSRHNRERAKAYVSAAAGYVAAAASRS